jgi:uncharacterized membrane protein YccC
VSSIVTLPRQTGREDDFFHETMGLAREESSFDHTRDSRRRRCDCVSYHRAARANARGYWAAIATLVVMQSTLGATLTLSIERIAATAVGASAGALEANYFRANLVAYAIAILLVGMLSFAFRLEKTAYRYASITLTIIVLIPRSEAHWATALHRFIEVSVGIIVALAVVALWPEHQRPSPDSTAE